MTLSEDGRLLAAPWLIADQWLVHRWINDVRVPDWVFADQLDAFGHAELFCNLLEIDA